ncbi:HD-GYP domain-containing protein [Aquibacillus saliphilus]|uniref:HD-GYP domain-containing protein n=1 Tax=Aquibacillus saliphilus TaxID=1909422 RepID=UPI001CF0D47C|nr:HD-GYP domain-containing protein [Aquibacillus saliphilus]
MQKRTTTSTLLNEEQRTVKWFLWLFYSIYFIYDLFYYYILPMFFINSEVGIQSGGLGYGIYVIVFGLLPISYYLIKQNKPELIKYLYFVTLTCMNILNDILLYWGSDASYGTGNIIEIVIVLFSPIFVNPRFFYLVSLGTILKYVIVGVVIQDPAAMLPLLIVVVLAMIAYILLHRFLGYVTAVKGSYDRQLEGIVKGIIATLELKDPYTRGHSERVAFYAISLAKATENFKNSELNSFYYACLLHDIGKVNIPDSILTKPGKLTAEEYDVIKTHPAVGAKAVQEVEGIEDHIDVIRHHHERWDGNGYPDKLKGEDTPLLTRITAISDAFDAMTSSRSYRPALPLEEAYNRIIEGKGTQFDPELVETFKLVYPSWVDYQKKYFSDNKIYEP